MNPGATATARILVVEDQEDVRRMLATALQIEGHAVDEAATATDGLMCLEQSRYDLVLSATRCRVEPGPGCCTRQVSGG